MIHFYIIGGTVVVGCLMVWWIVQRGSGPTGPSVTIVGDHPSANHAQIRELTPEGKQVEWEFEDDDEEPLPIVIDDSKARATEGGALYYVNLETGDVYLPDWNDLRDPNTNKQYSTPESEPGIDRIDAWTLREEQNSDTIEKIHRRQDDAFMAWVKMAPWAAGVIICLLLVMLYIMAG